MKRLFLALFLLAQAFAQTNNARMLSGVNPQTGTTYTFTSVDATRLTTFTNAATINATMPNGGTAGFGAGNVFSVQDLGPGSVVITCTSCLFFSGNAIGSATLTLSTGVGADIYGQGSNYYVQAGGGVSTPVALSLTPLQYGTIQAAVNAACASVPVQSVTIPSFYTGTDTYTNQCNATVTDLRAKGSYANDAATIAQLTVPWLVDESMGGNVSQFATCIQAGSCTIVWWGDSVTEGISQIAYENSWPGTLLHILRQRWPGVTFNFQNLSLGGRTVGNAGNAGYIGTVAPDIPANGYYRAPGGTDFPWPAGSTVGQSWEAAIQATAPDVVFIAFGQNDTSVGVGTEVNLVNVLVAFCQGFAKVPTIVLVPPYTPTQFSAPYSTQQILLEEFAAGNRQLAKAESLPIVDVGRVFQAMRDGTDVARPFFQLDQGFTGYPTNWSSFSGSASVGSGTATVSSSGWVGIKAYYAQDCDIDATFTWTGNAAPVEICRASPTNEGGAVYQAQLFVNGASSNITLYYGSTGLVTSSNFNPGSTLEMRYQAYAGEHRVWYRTTPGTGVWTLAINTTDYNAFAAGYWGVGIKVASGSITGTVTNLFADVGNPFWPCAAALVTQQAPPPCAVPNVHQFTLLGDASLDFGTDLTSIGGDGIHHPSMFGGTLFAVAASPLLRAVESTRSAQSTYYIVGTSEGLRDSGTSDLDIRAGSGTTGTRFINNAANTVWGNITSSNGLWTWLAAAGMTATGPLFSSSTVTGTQLVSNVSTGTAPITVTSTTPVTTLVVTNHPTVQDCGATTACANTAKTAAIIVTGRVSFPTATTVVITSLPFTSSTSYVCTAQDVTTAAGVINATTYTSGSSVTFTETNGTNTDAIRYQCSGT